MAVQGIIAAAAVIGAGASYQSAQETKKATKLQARQAKSRTVLERRQQVREARIARARAINASANQGSMGSSSQISAASGISNQLSFNLGQSYANEAVSQKASSKLAEAARYNTISSVAGIVQGAASGFVAPKSPNPTSPAAATNTALSASSASVGGGGSLVKSIGRRPY